MAVGREGKARVVGKAGGKGGRAGGGRGQGRQAGKAEKNAKTKMPMERVQFLSKPIHSRFRCRRIEGRKRRHVRGEMCAERDKDVCSEGEGEGGREGERCKGQVEG